VRKFILALILLLALVFISASFSEVHNIAVILQSGQWYYLGLAVIVLLVWLLNISFSYQLIYRIVGLEETISRLLLLSTAAQFVNTVTPAVAGMPSIAVFLTDARRRGHPSGKVLAAWAVFLVFDYIGLLAVVLLGLIVLIRRNNLHWSELFASVVLLLIAMGIALVLLLGMRSPKALGNLLAWCARRINRLSQWIRRKDFLSEKRAYTFSEDLAEGMSAVKNQPYSLLKPLLLAFSNKALLILVLGLIFLAFQVPFTSGTIIGGFSIGYLFVIVSPTPSGIGIVEGAMTLLLSTLGVPLEAATIITLGFRGITFWLPFFLGMVALRGLSAQGQSKLKEELN
jgi:uncharacterized protein (TIRG00374 family)